MSQRVFWLKVFLIFFVYLSCINKWQKYITSSSESETIERTDYELNENFEDSAFLYPKREISPKDYNQLVNISFRFTLLNSVCSGSEPLLLVLVHSSPRNFDKRRLIRNTWGRKDKKVKIGFMLGVDNTDDVLARLENENTDHRDLIQGSFVDSYKNMTYKHVMVFKYFIYHCPQAKYLLKTDDDVFVNMPLLKKFLTSDMSLHGTPRALVCNVRRHTKVSRSFRTKWGISFNEYPNRNYPIYCPGWVILYFPDVISLLYEIAQESNYFWIDDVHITGTLRKKINLGYMDIGALVIPPTYLRNAITNVSYIIPRPFLFGRPDMEESKIRFLWRYVNRHPVQRPVMMGWKLEFFS